MMIVIIVVKLFDAGYHQCIVNAPNRHPLRGFVQ